MDALKAAIAQGMSYTRIAGLAGQFARENPGHPLLDVTRSYLTQLAIPLDGDGTLWGSDDYDAFLDPLHAAVGDEIYSVPGRSVDDELVALDEALCGLRFVGDDSLADAVEAHAIAYVRFMAHCFTEHTDFARDFMLKHSVKPEDSFWGTVANSKSLADQMDAEADAMPTIDEIELPAWMKHILANPNAEGGGG